MHSYLHDIWSKIFLANQRQFVYLGIVFGVLLIFSRLPYINLFVNIWCIIFVMFFSSVFIFHMHMKIFFLYAIFFLVITLLSALAGINELTENFGNIVYGMIACGILSSMLSGFLSKND